MAWHMSTLISFLELKVLPHKTRKIADAILRDIENLQWSALNESSFMKAYSLLEEKYLGKDDLVLNDVRIFFFSCMLKVWIDLSFGGLRVHKCTSLGITK